MSGTISSENIKKFILTNASLILGCFTILIIKLLTYSEPLEYDITTYAVIAHEMLNGKTLYKELWDHKPPGNYIIFALFELLFGYGPKSILAINVIFSWLCLYGIYLIVKETISKQETNIAIILWCLLGGTISNQSNQPNCESLLNPLIVFGLLYLLRAKSKEQKNYPLLISGFFFAIASCIKHIVFFSTAIFSIYLIIDCARKKLSVRAYLKNLIIFILPTFISWTAITLYFSYNGNLNSYLECVFFYNKEYVGSLYNNIFPLINIWNYCPKFFAAIYSVLLLLSLFSFANNNSLIFISYATSSFLMVMLPGRYYPHYYGLLNPVLIIFSTIGIYNLKKLFPKKGIYIRSVIFICIIPYLTIELPIILKTGDSISKIKYHEANEFISSREYGFLLKTKFPKNYKFYNWGNSTGLYFYSQLSPATALFYEFPLSQGIHQRTRLERTVNELNENKPEAIIEKEQSSKPEMLNNIINNSYAEVNELNKFGYKIYLRRDISSELIR